MPAQQLPPLPMDPSIETGTLGCGASYYIVKAPLTKGYASIALVQKGDPLTDAKRAALSSAFLARMGVGPSRDGFLTEREGSTVYTFRDVPFYRKEVLDSMLLYTFTKMAESSAPQAIIVSGDVEPTVELKKKMDIFSLLVRKLDAPGPEPEYVWNPQQPVALDFNIGPGQIAVTYAGNRIPDIFMNTAQALVTDIFGLEFLVLLKNRLEKDFAREGVNCGSITFDSLRSCDYRGDERYTVRARIAPGQEDMALRVMARTLASIDATGVSVKEFTDAKEVLRPGLLRDASAMEDKIAPCIANFLFGANLAPAGERVRLFARKNVPEETETRLFNKFASALLAGEDNLTLELSARDTLDPAQALMVYTANYKNGLAVPYEADYTWHGADSAALDHTPPKVKIKKEKQETASGGTVWTFSNGIRVVFKEIRGSGMFSYALVLNGGLSRNPDFRPDSLYRVDGLPAPVFRDFLEVNGITLKAQAWPGSIIIGGDAPPAKFVLLLKSLLSISLNQDFNVADGAFIISGDLDTGVVKRMLARYLGGFPVQKTTSGRRIVETKPASAEMTSRGIRMAVEAPIAVTSDNFYLSYVAAMAMKQALIWELAPYGFTADVTIGPKPRPQEKFHMDIVCLPAPARGLSPEIGEPDVLRALPAVRAAITKAGKRLPSQADVEAWRAMVLDRARATLASPQGFTEAQKARYALNKDLNTRYVESIEAVTPEKVRGFLSALAEGSITEHVVE
ncbi:MAG: hypothetical protein IJU21_05800 [Bacteroidales bacterium]|nr:hypothetical protein [Bacteroidales bacterium]